MSKSGSSRLLVAGLVWLVIFAVAAMVYRWVFVPKKNEDLIQKTLPNVTTPSRKQHRDRVAVALDSFSGYCLFRSAALRDELSKREIGLDLVDDGADYARRFEALRKGETPLAVFTIDALIKASAKTGRLPATIVMLIDETTGADSIVAYQQSVPNLDALNKPEARLVLTPDSPSEMLARVVLAKFHLPALPAEPFVTKKGPAEVLAELRQADSKQPRAYVLWEPFVSKALEDKRAHVLIDSGSFTGYIVDVLIAERQYLIDHPQVVQAVLEAYFKVRYERQLQAQGMLQLVLEDARQMDPKNPLTTEQAERLVQGIRWKTTEENYAHFGLLPGEASRGLRHLEDMIHEITSVLLKTKAIDADPTGGSAAKLYYDKGLRALADANFHPEASTAGGGIAGARPLRPLADEEWQKLKPLGQVQVDALVFARASDRLLDQSEATLDNVVELLGRFPQSYLEIRGHARPEGDPEANRLLAEGRATAAAEYLISRGVARHRVKALAGATQLTGGEAQSVTFVLKQMPY